MYETFVLLFATENDTEKSLWELEKRMNERTTDGMHWDSREINFAWVDVSKLFNCNL